MAATSSEPALEARSIEFGYGGGLPALEAVSLRAPRGALVALLGPNGAGQSTLLRLLSGELQPRSGEVRVAGRPVRQYSRKDLARHVAVVPQQGIHLFPFSVEEVVLMGRFPHLARFQLEGPDDLAAASRAMAEADVAHLKSRMVTELSGGERQRVAIARALAQEAPILLLDEPEASLDVRHRLDIYGLLRRRSREEGAAVVVATHDVNLAARYSDEVVLLRGGRVAAAGRSDDVLRPEVLEEVFEVRVAVLRDPISDRPLIVFGER